MKKLPAILAATTLLTSIGAFADVLRNDASPFAVNVPNIRSGFEVSIEGLSLRPSNADLSYGVLTLDPNGNTTSQLLNIKPDNDSSWGVGVGYVFPDSGNDVQLSWTEFSHTEPNSFAYTERPSNFNDSLLTPFGVSILLNNPDNNIDDNDGDNDGDEGDITAAVGHATFKVSAIDLNAGQYLDVGTRLQLRPFAGLRFAKVENNLTANIRVDNSSTNGLENDAELIYTETDALQSKFSGIGPLLGVDANYQLGGEIHASAHLATSLLVGKVDADSHYAFSNTNLQGLTPGNRTLATDSDNQWRVVPAFDAKLGLNYSYAFDCDSVATLEGGYKVSQYLDVVDRHALSGSGMTKTTSSVGLAGPYVKLSFKF